MRPITDLVRMDRDGGGAANPGGGWLTARQQQPEARRDRLGRHVTSAIDGIAGGLGLQVVDPFRILTPPQLFMVYQRCPDVRASIDSIARRIATWNWTVEVDLDEDDPNYQAALDVADQATRFLQAPNANGETWQEVAFAWIVDLLNYEHGTLELCYDKLVSMKVPIPSMDADQRQLEQQAGTSPDGTGETARVPAPDAKLVELVALNGGSIVPQQDALGRLYGYRQDTIGTLSAFGMATSTSGDPMSAPWISREQIVALRLFPSTSGRSCPLIETLVNEIITLLRSSEHAMLAMDADEIPPGILVLTGIAGKAAEAAKEDLQRLKGKDHKIRVVTNPDPRATGASWVELRRTPKDLSMLDIVREIRRTVWRVFGVMPVEMGASDAAPRATAEVQLDAGSSHLVEPILEQVQAKVNARIIPVLVGKEWAGKVVFRFNKDAKLSPAEEVSKATALVSLVKEGVLSRNEARRNYQPGLRPNDGGDVMTITTSTGLVRLTALDGDGPIGAPPADGSGGAPPPKQLPGPVEPVADGGDPGPGEADGGAAQGDGPAPGEGDGGTGRGQPLAPSAPHAHGHARARDDLPSDWPEAARFKGYRTIHLAPLAETIGEYSRTITPIYADAQAETLAAVAAEIDGTLNSEGAQRVLSAVDRCLTKLVDTWGTATAPLYQRAARIGRDSATHWSAVPVVADWSDRATAYGSLAIGYLSAAGGLVADLRSDIARIVGHAATDGEGTRSRQTDVQPGADEAEILSAVAASFVENEHRIENWSGRLVELANQVMTDGMGEGAAGNQTIEEWYFEWVAVGDARMCTTCAREGAQPFRPQAQMTVQPGGGTECRARCRCVIVYWTRGEVDSGSAVSLSGARPGNPVL